MSSRTGGAVLALTAAVLLAVSSFPLGDALGTRGLSSWWSGFPTIDNHRFDRKEVHVGLLKASGCDITEDGDVCRGLSIGSTFTVVRYVELGLVGALALALAGLGIATLQQRDARRVFARIALAAAAASAIVSIVLLVMGPDLKTGKSESVPMAMFGGLGLYFLGAACAIVSGVLALMPKRAVAPVWAKQLPATAQPRVGASALPPPAQPVDVLALLHEDAPVMGRPVSTGGMLPGPSGPLAPPHASASQPLFSSAPQLRPLYEASSEQGGSSGFVAPPQPVFPTRAPTPMPAAAVSAITGLPTPPPAFPEPRTTLPQMPVRGGVAEAPTIPAGRPLPPPPRAGSALPTPLRSKPPSVAPPIARTATPTRPPPPPTRPPPVGTSMPPRSQPTIATAAVPPPRDIPLPASLAAGAAIATPGGTLAGPPGLSMHRPESDPGDRAETVDFQKQARPSGSRKAVDTEPVPLATGDSTSPSVPFETVTGEASASFANEVVTGTDVEGVAAPGGDSSSSAGGDSHSIDDAIETAAREKISAQMPAVRVSNAVMTSAPKPLTEPVALPPVPPVPSPMTASPPPPQVEPPKRASEQVAPVKVPISTAPSTLPPPKEKPSAVAGPSPACPQCEAPMAWVEEHLRFYCKSCRMYF